MSEGYAFAVWTIWTCDHGPMKGQAVVLQDHEGDTAMAEALANAIGQPVEAMDWDRARTTDGSGWNAGEGLDSEESARAAAVEQGYTLIVDRALSQPPDGIVYHTTAKPSDRANPGGLLPESVEAIDRFINTPNASTTTAKIVVLEDEADHHLVAHLYALYDAANRRLPPWVGEVEASNPEVHARVMALGLWFSLSHTQGNLTEAGAALLRAHPRVSDAPVVLADPARGDVLPWPSVEAVRREIDATLQMEIEEAASAQGRVPPAAPGTHILICPSCGDELQCRYPAWFYERDGQLVLADIDFEAKCQGYYCSTCSDRVDGPIEAREPASDGSAAAVDEILLETSQRPLVPAAYLVDEDPVANRCTAEMNAEIARAAAGLPPATPDMPMNQPVTQGLCMWCYRPATEGNGLCKTCDQNIPC